MHSSFLIDPHSGAWQGSVPWYFWGVLKARRPRLHCLSAIISLLSLACVLQEAAAEEKSEAAEPEAKSEDVGSAENSASTVEVSILSLFVGSIRDLHYSYRG